MFADARIKNAVEALVAGVEVPHVQWPAIATRIAQPQPIERRPSRVVPFALAAAACLAIVFVAFPASSLGLARIVVSSYQDVIDAGLENRAGVRDVYLSTLRWTFVHDSNGAVRSANGATVKVYVRESGPAGRTHGAPWTNESPLERTREVTRRASDSGRARCYRADRPPRVP